MSFLFCASRKQQVEVIITLTKGTLYHLFNVLSPPQETNLQSQMFHSRRAHVVPMAMTSSQRLIWSRASDIVSWLNSFRFQPLPDTCTSSTEQQSVKCEPSLNHVATTCVLRPQLHDDVPLPTYEQGLGLKKRKSAAYALRRFSHKMKHVPTSKQLLDAWHVMSQCRPFVVHKEDLFQVRLASIEDVRDERPWLLQIVPGNVFAQFAANISTRYMFVGSTNIEQTAVNVVVANEALLMSHIVQVLHGMNEHELVVAFFEAYNRDRSGWLQEDQLHAATTTLSHVSITDEENEAKAEVTEEKMSIQTLTRLPHAIYSYYLRSLDALRQSEKIVRIFDNNEYQFERICGTIPNLRLILYACYNEKNGDLARRAIDTISKSSPAAVIPLSCYELAIRANLRDRNRDKRELMNAIHLARALLNDGGYILKPQIWSGLVKVSLRMDHPDLALEVFKTYPRHCIPEYQNSFRQVLRTASRFASSTALDIMHFCWFSYDADYPNAKVLLDERKAYQDAICLNSLKVNGLSLENTVLTSDICAVNKEAETEMLNLMLWELLKHHRFVPSVVQVLDLMEATCSKGGAMVLRKAVLSIFEYDMNEKKMSPRTALESSLKFWKKHASVLHGQGYLVHLLLEECIKHHFDDECEFLVNYLLNLNVDRMPIDSIVKMMGANEIRGRFDANARIGTKLLKKLSRMNRAGLRDDFYERYLMSYLRLEQFDKVNQTYVDLKLEKRYPHNKVIQAIVQDAVGQI